MAEIAVPDSEEAQGLAGVKTINVRLAQNEDGDDVHGLVLASSRELKRDPELALNESHEKRMQFDPAQVRFCG